VCGPGAEAQDGGRGERGGDGVAACEHVSPLKLFLVGAFWAGVARMLAGIGPKFL
jgi:hypothetical protein